MQKTILFVDDERQILRALRRLFHKSEHNILIANGGMEGLAALKNNKVDMLITDMRMPVMDGYELLTRVKAEYPDIIRIALSGYTDKNLVLSALDKNLVKIYLFKPWNNDEIIQTINNLFEFEKILKDKNLLDVVNNLHDLPTIPKLYNTISEMVQNEEPVNNIAKCIENDPAIASRILRISNSAYFGAKTGDIKQAIMFIGLANVKNIILSNSVFGARGKNSSLLEKEFNHSSLTNRILNDIYKKLLKKTLPNDCKSAGLLHNIGKGILLINYDDKHDFEVLHKIEDLGISHQKIGSFILNWWELPLPIVESAMFHLNPESMDIMNKELVNAVHLAQHYAYIVAGLEPEGELSLTSYEALGLSQNKVEAYIEELTNEGASHGK